MVQSHSHVYFFSDFIPLDPTSIVEKKGEMTSMLMTLT